MSSSKSKASSRRVLKESWYRPLQSSSRALPAVEPALISPDKTLISPSASATFEVTVETVKQIDQCGAQKEALLFRWLCWLYLLGRRDHTLESRTEIWSYIVNSSIAGRGLRSKGHSQPGMPANAQTETRVMNALLAAYWIRFLSTEVPESEQSPEDDYQEGLYSITVLSRIRIDVLEDERKMRRLLKQIGRFEHTSTDMEKIANHIDSK
jgi:hypothetical protein